MKVNVAQYCALFVFVPVKWKKTKWLAAKKDCLAQQCFERGWVNFYSVLNSHPVFSGWIWCAFFTLTRLQGCRRSTGTTTHAATACSWSPGSSLQRACGASSSSLKAPTVQRQKSCELNRTQWQNGVDLNLTSFHNHNSAHVNHSFGVSEHDSHELKVA